MIRAILDRIPPGQRYAIRERLKGLAEQGRRAAFWSWTRWTMPAPTGAPGVVSYLGGRRLGPLAVQAFGDPAGTAAGGAGPVVLKASDVPLAGGLRVPIYLRLLIDVTPPFETVLSRAAHGMWRQARRLAERATIVPVTEDAEIERVSAELLVPYAARHKEGAHQIPLETVRQLAREGGLVSIRVDGEEVAARLGQSYTWRGRRHFQAWRFGYPSSVFDMPRRYGEMNALNTYLSIRHAKESGHEVLDFGLSPASPVENGWLQFKRLRGAAVTTVNTHSHFSVRIDPAWSARFLWARPLFSVERRRLVLNLGVPPTLGDGELVERVRKNLVFRGVSVLRLHAQRAVDDQVIQSIRRSWDGDEGPGSPPDRLEVDVVSGHERPGPSAPPESDSSTLASQ